MKGSDILEFIKNESDLSHCFQELCEYHKLPQLKQNKFVICFKDSCHWVAYSKFCNLEIFNSLGNNKKEIEELLPYEKVIFNTTKLQSDTSKLCAKFVLYYCVIRINNIDIGLAELLNLYLTDDFERNDAIVNHFFDTGEFHEG